MCADCICGRQGREYDETDELPRGTVPPGTYAGGARSPVVYVLLCPVCAGYAPTLPEDFPAEAHCQGCGAYVR